MRSTFVRCAPLATVAAIVLLGHARVRGQEKKPSASTASPSEYEARAGLYAAAEMALGGRPLFQQLFPNGWPTTREYRRMALEHGEAAFEDNVESYLGSGLGVPLAVSSVEKERLAERQKSETGAPESVASALKARFEAFRQLTGLPGPVDDGFMPVMLPYRRGDSTLVTAYDETRPQTWSWDPKKMEAVVSLDGVGLSIYAELLLAEQQLTHTRKVSGSSGDSSFVGRTDMDGFMAFCALNCAVDALGEVRAKLCLDLKSGGEGKDKGSLGPYPKLYNPAGESARKTYYPHAAAVVLTSVSATYSPVTTEIDKKSHLFDQAALLLGVCELARAAEGTNGIGRFFNGEKKTAFFDPQTASQAADLASFLVESIYGLHCTATGKPGSYANVDDPSNLLRVEDAGLLLLGLESFVSLAVKSDKLAASQTHAKRLVELVAAFLVNVQKTSKVAPGYCDAFDLGSETATNGNASLAAQGLAVRGLLAAKRTFASPAFTGRPGVRPDVLGAAEKTLDYLERQRWDPARHAYVDTPGQPGKARAFDAFAVLGALRDFALEKKDIRYLGRYKSYLGTIRARGIQRAVARGSAEPPDAAKKALTATAAPVVAVEVDLP